MAAPVISRVAEKWSAELSATQRDSEQNNWAFQLLLGALARPFRVLHDLVSDSDDGPGWSALVDPARTPSPRWTGQLNGVRVTTGASDAQQRAQVGAGSGMLRGTTAAMRAALEPHLTDTRLIRIVERSASPYSLLVVTRTSETPDIAAAEAAARAQKPAGLILTFVTSDAPLIDEGDSTIIDAAPVPLDTATVADIN